MLHDNICKHTNNLQMFTVQSGDNLTFVTFVIGASRGCNDPYNPVLLVVKLL